MIWYGSEWYGMVRYGTVRYGMVWFGMVWYGMVWYGMVWYGIWYVVWYMVCMQGLSAQGKSRTVVLKTLMYVSMDRPMHEILVFIAYAQKSVLKVLGV